MAGRLAHAHHDGPRRDRDGPLVTRHPARRGCGVTPTPGRSSPRCATANGSPRSARSPRSAPSATRYDNALAETVNGYYKAELIRGPARERRPWKTVEDVELATLGWVHWHNHQRLHGYLGDVPPAEFEQAFYATNRTDQTLVEIQ